MERLAERGVEIFFTQVFDHSFFHADMHPGNVFVDISDPENPVYKAVDFGIVGTLDPTSQAYLAQNLIAFLTGTTVQLQNSMSNQDGCRRISTSVNSKAQSELFANRFSKSPWVK